MSSQLSDEEIYRLARKRVKEKKEFFNHLAVYIVINALLVVIWAITSRAYPWFVWPLAGWGVGLIFHGLGVFVFNKETAREREEVEKEAEKLRRGQK